MNEQRARAEVDFLEHHREQLIRLRKEYLLTPAFMPWTVKRVEAEYRAKVNALREQAGLPSEAEKASADEKVEGGFFPPRWWEPLIVVACTAGLLQFTSAGGLLGVVAGLLVFLAVYWRREEAAWRVLRLRLDELETEVSQLKAGRA